MKKYSISLALFLVVLFALWQFWTREPEATLGELEFQAQSTEEVGEVRRQAEQSTSSHSAQNPETEFVLVQFRVVDRASQKIQPDCSLIWVGSPADPVSIDPEVEMLVKRKLFNRLRNFSEVEESKKTIEIVVAEKTFSTRSVELSTIPGSRAFLATITIDRFAKLVVVADLGEESPRKWSCRTSSFSVAPKESSGKLKKYQQFLRNIPDAHRSIIGRGQKLSYDKSHKRDSSKNQLNSSLTAQATSMSKPSLRVECEVAGNVSACNLDFVWRSPLLLSKHRS